MNPYAIVAIALFVALFAWSWRKEVLAVFSKFRKSKPDHERLIKLWWELTEGCAECGIDKAVEDLKPIGSMIVGHKHEGNDGG